LFNTEYAVFQFYSRQVITEAIMLKCITKEQTTKLPKEKVQRTKNDLQNIHIFMLGILFQRAVYIIQRLTYSYMFFQTTVLISQMWLLWVAIV
jgi:hypothetical protein